MDGTGAGTDAPKRLERGIRTLRTDPASSASIAGPNALAKSVWKPGLGNPGVGSARVSWEDPASVRGEGKALGLMKLKVKTGLGDTGDGGKGTEAASLDNVGNGADVDSAFTIGSSLGFDGASSIGNGADVGSVSATGSAAGVDSASSIGDGSDVGSALATCPGERASSRKASMTACSSESILLALLDLLRPASMLKESQGENDDCRKQESMKR